LATIRDLEIKLTVDTDVASGLARASLAFRETVREADNAQDRLDRLGRSSRDVDNLGMSISRLSGHLGVLGAQGLFAVGKLGALTGSVLALAGAASSAIVPIGGLLASLAPLAGGLALLPGVVTGLAGAFGVLTLALAGASDLFKAIWEGNEKQIAEKMGQASTELRGVAEQFLRLRDNFMDVKNAVQDAFWLQLASAVKNVFNAFYLLEPALRETASAFGVVASTAISAITRMENLFSIQQIIRDVGFSVRTLNQATSSLITGFLKLGQVGTGYLRGLADAAAEVGVKFGHWLAQIAANGQALEWIKQAVEVAKQLGSVFKDLSQIVGGVFEAMRAAGTGALGVLGKILDLANEWVNSAEGQKTLIAIFQALSAIGATLTPVLEALAKAIGGIAPEVAELAKLVGPVLQDFIEALADGINQMLPGLKVFMQALRDGLHILLPILGSVGELFGALFKALAPLLPVLASLAKELLHGLVQALFYMVDPLKALIASFATFASLVGPVISDVIQELAIIFAKLLTAVAPLLPVVGKLIEVLGKAFVEVLSLIAATLEPLLPILTDTAVLIGKALVDAVVQVAPLLVDFVREFLKLLPAIVPIIPQLAALAVQYLPLMVDVLKILLPQSAELAKLFIQILQAVLPLLPRILQMSAAWLPVATNILKIAVAVSDFLLPIFDKFLPKVINVVQKVVGWFQWLFDTLLGHSIIPDIANGIKKWFDRAVGWIFDAIEFLKNLPGKIGDFISRAKDAAIEKFNDIVTFVQQLPQRIINALGDFGNLLYNSGRNLLQGLINGLWSMVQNVLNTVGDILGRIRAAFPFSPAKWGPFSGHGYTTYSGAAMMRDFAKGISSQSGLVDKALTAALSHELTPTLTPNVSGFALAPNNNIPQFAGIGPTPNGAGSIVIQNLTLQFADDRDMYTKGQEFAAGLFAYKSKGGVIPTP
jgi:phage-related protein